MNIRLFLMTATVSLLAAGFAQNASAHGRRHRCHRPPVVIRYAAPPRYCPPPVGYATPPPVAYYRRHHHPGPRYYRQYPPRPGYYGHQNGGYHRYR